MTDTARCSACGWDGDDLVAAIVLLREENVELRKRAEKVVMLWYGEVMKSVHRSEDWRPFLSDPAWKELDQALYESAPPRAPAEEAG